MSSLPLSGPKPQAIHTALILYNPTKSLPIPHNSFPQFSKLSLELRRMIFREMFPERRLIGFKTTGQYDKLELHRTVPPITASINRESREETKLCYHIWALQRSNTHVRCRIKPVSKTIMVNFDLDVFDLPACWAITPGEVDLVFRQLSLFLYRFHHVVISLEGVHAMRFHLALWRPKTWYETGLKAVLGKFPQLETLEIRYACYEDVWRRFGGGNRSDGVEHSMNTARKSLGAILTALANENPNFKKPAFSLE